jgi:hypothetical protein
MDQQQRDFIAERYAASQWLGGPGSPGQLTDVTLTGAEAPGWTLVRSKRNEGAGPPSLVSMWRRPDADDEVVSVRIVECPSPDAAREQLLEELGAMQSPVIERQAGRDAPGDVAFGLGETMVAFARANLVLVISNAGRKAVSVTAVARDLDRAMRDRLERTGT